MRTERVGLAQTPRHLRLGAAILLIVAVGYGTFAGVSGRHLFWGFWALFTAWSIYLFRLAARWSKEDDMKDEGTSQTA